MEPVIRNFRNVYTPEGPGARLVGLNDNPTTCTLSYGEIYPGKTSSHHIHEWEHEVYIIKGSGTLFCDGKEYPVKAGDAMYIPGNVDHYTLNNGGDGDIDRIEINPLIAAQSGGAQNNGGEGTGEPPVIHNHADLDRSAGHVLLGSKDGVPNYVMLHNDPMQPGAVSHAAEGGHTHPWDHVIYVLDGEASIVCEGTTYAVKAGDAVLVPPNVFHQWRNDTQTTLSRVTFNAVASETAEH
jgi:quercetin dioxygenase-like cupin family protein